MAPQLEQWHRQNSERAGTIVTSNVNRMSKRRVFDWPRMAQPNEDEFPEGIVISVAADTNPDALSLFPGVSFVYRNTTGAVRAGPFMLFVFADRMRTAINAQELIKNLDVKHFFVTTIASELERMEKILRRESDQDLIRTAQLRTGVLKDLRDKFANPEAVTPRPVFDENGALHFSIDVTQKLH